MALFGRRGAPADDAVLADPAFPFLSASQADRVRMMVHRAFLEAQVEMVVHPQVAVDAWGRPFDLGPVMAACHVEERGPAAWAHVVHAHVSAALAPLVEPEQDGLPDLPLEVLLSCVYPLLVHARDVPLDAAVPSEVAPQLTEVLQLVLPEPEAANEDDDELHGLDEAGAAVDAGRGAAAGAGAAPHGSGPTVLRVADVEQLGPPAEVRERALSNLAAVEPDWHVIARDGGRIDVVTTPEPLAVALTLLFPRLPERLTRKAGPADPRLGVFFAVPFAGQLDLHVLRDATARTSLRQLALFASAGFTDAVGQISPDVYWWHAGRVERLTHLTPKGVAIMHLPELDAVLDELERPAEVPAAPLAARGGGAPYVPTVKGG